MIQLENEVYLQQSNRVIEFIDQQDRENVEQLIMIHVVVDNDTDWTNLREFRLVLWTKLKMSRYAAKIGMLIDVGSVATIKNNENAENTYAIRCCKQNQVEQLENHAENYARLSFAVQI